MTTNLQFHAMAFLAGMAFAISATAEEPVNDNAGTTLLRTFKSEWCSMQEPAKADASTLGLKDALGDKFLIGAALNSRITSGLMPEVTAIIRKHFNAAVAENCMKSGELQPTEGQFNWQQADELVNFCKQNNLTLTGHCLVWHSQAPRWMFVNADGQQCDSATLVRRIHDHIFTVMGHFRGQVKGWDVLNEAFNDDGSFRQTQFLRIIGPDYFRLIFKFAHEADPDAELYYNDFSMDKAAKREAVCRLVRSLKAAGCRVDAVGMQSHVGLTYPDLNEYQKSIEAFAAEGVKVMVTELDLTVLPEPGQDHGASINRRAGYSEALNPYKNGLPDSVSCKMNERYRQLFDIYLKERKVISRVTLWGVTDDTSWRNNWPVPGRRDYPLLFNRDFTPKPAVQEIIKDALAH